MSWNYRVFRESYPGGAEEYVIREAYYDGRGCEKGTRGCDCVPKSWTSDPVAPSGTTINDLRWSLKSMLKALDGKVLTKEELECKRKKSRTKTSRRSR